ncbi:uroporphyrinogen-III synthase [Pseudoalteromonas rubra]|uniref:Uroporphyrinogen-III synthase n=1 Tax=Pseudoalteromonas rubra TaxID=43658 RepID=A0A8T0CA18_9GAMM|nr:uroporphyrinogen-III C-methyltransferase [Pseudoalteromonas rubra]KAF7787577.1 uroporphyrinogen-III synthase [Pseudoalteromonas rubra]
MKLAITRPAGKGTLLGEQLEAQGISCDCTPVLELVKLPVSETELAPIMEAEQLIFISQDAVYYLAQHQPTFSPDCQFFAVGEKTAAAIDACFDRRAIVPEQHDSEGLLALPALQQIEDNRVVVVKGRGGRTLINKMLKQRGARVSHCVVYERIPAATGSDIWLDHWQRQGIDGIVITSNAAIDAIFNTQQSELLNWLSSRRFYLVSQRSAEYLREQYAIKDKQIAISAGADNDALLACIMDNQPRQGGTMTEQQQSQSGPQSSDKSPKPAAVSGKISKTAVLALLVALTSGVGAAGVYYLGQQQLIQYQQTLAQLTQDNQQLQGELASSKQTLAELHGQLAQRDQAIAQQLKAQTRELEQRLQATLQTAKQQLGGAQKAEIAALTRSAEFQANIQRHYLAAAATLTRLHTLVREQSNTTTVQTAIAADLALLKAQPKPQLEALYLDLHGYVTQADDLPLQIMTKPADPQSEQRELTEQVSDWKANAWRSWLKIQDQFIKVRTHDKPVIDPLLDAQEQQLIRAQLNSYLRQAQTALMQQQQSVYFTALEGAGMTLARYYRSDNSAVVAMQAGLKALQQKEFAAQATLELQTPQAVKEWLQ